MFKSIFVNEWKIVFIKASLKSFPESPTDKFWLV